MADEVVKYHNKMNEIIFTNFKAVEMDLFYSLCTRIKNQKDTEVTMTFQEIRELSKYKLNGNAKLHADIFETRKKIMKLDINIVTDKDDDIYILFPTFKISKEFNTVTIGVNKDFAFLLNELEGSFTRFELLEFTNLESKYAKTAYRLLKQWRTVGVKEWSLDQFKTLLSIPNSYNMRAITQRVLDPIEAELSPIFKGLKISKETSGRGGKVTALKFTFQKEVTPKKGYNPNMKQARKVKAHEQQALLLNESPESRAESPMPADISAALGERIKNLRSSGKTFD